MRILGIYLDGSCLRAAILESFGKKKAEIETLRSAPLSDPQNVKELYISSFSGKVAGAIPSQALLLRQGEVNLPKSRHSEEILRFHSEAVAHCKQEEFLFVPLIIQREGPKAHVLFHFASRQAIQETLQGLQEMGLDPDCLSASPRALGAYLHWKFPDLEKAVVIHLGAKEWVCALFEKGHIHKTSTILEGNEGLLSALWEDRKKILLQREAEGVAKQIDLLQLKSHLNPHLSHKLNEMKGELTRAVLALGKENPCLFTGSTDTFGHYCEFLSETFLSSRIGTEIPLDELKHALPLGLALEQLQEPLQLRKEEFFPKKRWRQTGKHGLFLFSASLLLSVSLLFGGNYFLSSQQATLLHHLKTFLEKKDPAWGGRGEEELLYQWEKEKESYQRDFPYISSMPKVAEVLSWYSLHPLVRECSLTLQDFTYQLSAYPHLGALEESYGAKVELEFETDSPLSARQFHQALLKGDRIVDPRQEIGWESLDANRYRVSFFLKSQEGYVP